MLAQALTDSILFCVFFFVFFLVTFSIIMAIFKHAKLEKTSEHLHIHLKSGVRSCSPPAFGVPVPLCASVSNCPHFIYSLHFYPCITVK